MEARTNVIISFFVLVILITGIYFFTDWFSKTTGYVLGEDEKVKLAQCLSGRGNILYVSEECFSCDKQLEVFGDSAVEFLKIVTCQNAETCAAEGGVPAWKISGEFHYGIQELNDLLEISECGVE